MQNYTVRLFSPWRHEPTLTFGGICFSTKVPLEEADAALWEYSLDQQILDYKGVKAWYCSEPRWHSMYRSKEIRRICAKLREGEWLHYAHSNPEFRVPHVTRYGGKIEFCNGGARLENPVAIVSNFGGRAWFLRFGFRLRNKLVTNPRVRLYGRRNSWEHFRPYGPISRPATPANYCGELEWANTWVSDEQVLFLSKFKVAIALENSTEPFYFSEKFVNAARAGCIPIYHAHPSVASGILKGAFWIDPADHGFDPDKTIDAALMTSLEKVQAQNRSWLLKEETRNTFFEEVWERIAQIFRKKINGDFH